MFGIGPDYTPLMIAAVALVVWHRCFCREGKFSLLSLFILITGAALWLLVFLPGHWMPF